MDRTASHHQIQTNPQIGKWLGAAAIAVGVAIAGYEVYDHLRTPKPPALPPKVGGGAPTPTPTQPTPPQPCGDPARYPGFVSIHGVCKPSAQTPPGIYMLGGCTDFVFVKGDTGPQATALDNAITIAAKATSADPSIVVTTFLKTRWPDCTWPPRPNDPARVVQMWQVLGIVAGRMILAKGGTVFGTQDPEEADVAITDRYRALGYPDLDPSIVPELEIPKIQMPEPEPEPQGGGGGGVLPPEPGPKQGHIDLGPQGPAGPHGHIPEPPPDCAVSPYLNAIQTNLPRAKWTEQKYVDIPLFTPSGQDCKHYDIRFGMCVTPINGSFGWLDSYFAGNEDAIYTIFQIRDANMEALPNLDAFHLPVLWKQQYRCRVRYMGANVLHIDVGGELSMIDDPSVDACSNKSKRGPAGLYRVQPTTEDGYRFWNPTPSVIVHTSGKTLYARISYSGLVQFVRVHGQAGGHPQDYGRARMDLDTKFLAQTKVYAIGST